MTIDLDSLLEEMECKSREFCLEEAINRVNYFFKQTDGSYNIPECHPQVQQVLELVIAAAHK